MKIIYILLIFLFAFTAYSKINKITPNTGAPGISVDDYFFVPYALSADGNNPVVQSAILRIKNECEGTDGTHPLIIIGYTEPTLKEYTHNLPVINEDNPLTLIPGEEQTFRVNFAPTKVGNFLDSIVFQTDTDWGCDNVCILGAKSLDVGLFSQEYDWGKVRINYSKQPTNIYEPIGSELITVINTSTGELANNLIISNIIFESVKGPAGTNKGFDGFSFESNFVTKLPSNSNNYFKNIRIEPIQKSIQRKIYFRPTIVGEYEITYYFNSNGEIKGEESRYVIKGHGIVPNLYLYHDDNGTENTDIVNFGSVEAGKPAEAVRKTLTITNQPKDIENGDVLTIYSIDWGANATTDINELGVSKNFYFDEAKILADLGGSGAYPISLGIGESFNIDVTYFTNEEDMVHSNNILIDSDADDSGLSGKYNDNITLTGNSVINSVKQNKTNNNFYPNPANNFITFDKSIKGNIEIYNLLGEKVRDFESNLKSTFDISNLQNGIYIIKYKINGQFYSEKLSVSR